MIRLLLVDDDPSLLDIGKLFLKKSGAFSIETAESAVTALEMLAVHPFDAVISDYEMPVTDGIAFLREVRRRYRDLPFILFTGRGREEVVIEALNSGADFYVQKGGDPVSQFADLTHKIMQATEKKKQRTHLKERKNVTASSWKASSTASPPRARTASSRTPRHQ